MGVFCFVKILHNVCFKDVLTSIPKRDLSHVTMAVIQVTGE